MLCFSRLTAVKAASPGAGVKETLLSRGVTVHLLFAGSSEKPFDVRSERRSGSPEGTNKRIS